MQNQVGILRTLLFWDIMQQVVVPSSAVKILTPDDGTDMVSRNTGKKSKLLIA
jgi:hypothetical protein